MKRTEVQASQCKIQSRLGIYPSNSLALSIQLCTMVSQQTCRQRRMISTTLKKKVV